MGTEWACDGQVCQVCRWKVGIGKASLEVEVWHRLVEDLWRGGDEE